MILITGGLGFLGVSLAKYLVDNGQVVLVTRHRNPNVPDILAPHRLNAILFKTGAAPLYGTDAYFKHYLEIHPETVRWMAKQGILLWGVDASTVDHAHNKATHMLLRELEFYHMENLANLDALPVNSPFTLACVALPFVGATASPLRPLAILKD